MIPALTSQTNPNEVLSLQAMLERLTEIISETSWRSRSISHTIFSIQHHSEKEARKNHADSYRSLMPTLMKVASFASVIGTAAQFIPNNVGTILDHTITGFAQYLDSNTKAYQIDEQARGELAAKHAEQATGKKNAAENTLSESLRIISGVHDAVRSTIHAMHQKTV